MLYCYMLCYMYMYTRHTVHVCDYFIFIFSSRNDIESLKTELDKLRLSVSVASPSGATSGRGRGRGRGREGKGEEEGEGEGEGEGDGERERGRGREGGSNERSGIKKGRL